MQINTRIIFDKHPSNLFLSRFICLQPERIEKLIVEDMSLKKLPKQFFTMIPKYFAMAKNALRQVPDGVDEATAMEIIVQFILNSIPKEAVSDFIKMQGP